MSTVADNMQTLLKQKAQIQSDIIHQIDFYKPIRGNMRRRPRTMSNQDLPEDQLVKELANINEEVDFDDPQQLDFDLLRKGLELLKENRPFNKPVYDKFYKIRTQETVNVMPHPVIIVEGALIFCDPDLRSLFDLTVWVDTDDDVRLSRRVLKNEQQEGIRKQKLPDLLQKYEERTKPAFEKFIEPTKKFAKTIIPNYGFSAKIINLEKMDIPGVDLVITHVIDAVTSQKK